MSSQPELKAKRTHARRSCDLCKVRKTRCELPDLDIASSSEPLPADKACHRCRVLALPCIVDDTTRKRGKAPRASEDGLGSGAASPRKAKPRKSAPAPGPFASNGGAVGAVGVNHEMDLMHAFHPSQDYVEETQEAYGRREPTNGQAHGMYYSHYDPFLQAPHNAEAGPSRKSSTNIGATPEEVQDMQEKGMRFHGRALELVCAMLRVAYGKTSLQAGRKAAQEVDIKAILSPDMIVRLEGGLMQLKTFHPYLDPFAKECKGMEELTPAEKLLLATVIYLCTLQLPADQSVRELRLVLAPFIEMQRDQVMLTSEQNFYAIQALEVLAAHAPFGLLPLQPGNVRNLELARGQISTARSIATGLAFPNLAKVMVVVTKRYDYFQESDYWLWVCLTLQECSIGLECESMHRPKHLPELVPLVEKFMDPSMESTWLSAMETTELGVLIGRLSVIDRICRFGEVFDRLERLRGVLETAAQDVDFDPVGAMVEEMTSFGHRIDQLDQRHDFIMSILAPAAAGLEAGWLAYRGLSRRAVMNKVHMMGMRYIIATAYLPGHPLSFPNLKATTGNALSTRLSFAIKKATQPADIMAFLQRSDAGVQAVWNFGVHRGNIAEANLGAFADLESIMLPGPPGSGIAGHLLPMHEIIAIVTECAKFLMEVEGAATLMRRSAKTANRPFKPPTWVYAMQQACALLSRLGSMSERVDGAESIANGCSNILGSMVRITHEWMKSSASGTPSGSMDDGSSSNVVDGQPQGMGAAYGDAGPASHLPPPSLADAIRSLPPPPPETHNMRAPEEEHHSAMHNQQMLHAQVQQYMDTSDRWMAGETSNAPPPPPPAHAYPAHGHGKYPDDPYKPQAPAPYPSHGHGHEQGMQHQPQPAQATNLDLLLSQMFNYSGPAGHHHGHHPPHPRPLDIPQGMGAGNEQFAAETGWSNAYNT